jgi:hypothetical protein
MLTRVYGIRVQSNNSTLEEGARAGEKIYIGKTTVKSGESKEETMQRMFKEHGVLAETIFRSKNLTGRVLEEKDITLTESHQNPTILEKKWMDTFEKMGAKIANTRR